MIEKSGYMYSGDQNVISEVIMAVIQKLGHFSIHGHNHINGMIEKVRRYQGKWTFEHNGKSLVTVFHGGKLILTNPTWIGSKKHGFRTNQNKII